MVSTTTVTSGSNLLTANFATTFQDFINLTHGVSYGGSGYNVITKHRLHTTHSNQMIYEIQTTAASSNITITVFYIAVGV